MKIDDEHCYILLCIIFYFAKRELSDILEGVFSKNSSGCKPPDSHFLTPCLPDRNILANAFLLTEADV